MESPVDNAQSMYVQMALRAVFDGSSLTLLDLAPATLFVAEAPATAVGHLPTGLFLDHWYADASGEGTRGVPAVLALLDAEHASDANAQVILRLPRIRETGLEYQVTVVEGEVRPTSGACVLFIRPLATPATPTETAHAC
jgi:hypothetical protein